MKCQHLTGFHAECRVTGEVVDNVQKYTFTARVRCKRCGHWFVFPHGGDQFTIPIAPAMPAKSAVAAAVEQAASEGPKVTH